MFLGLVFIMIAVGTIYGVYDRDKNFKKTDEYKKKVEQGVKPRKLLMHRKWWIWAVSIFLVIAGFGKIVDGFNATDSSASKTHKVAKKKPLTKAQKEKIAEKKQIQKNIRGHIPELKNALKKLPDKTQGAITGTEFDNSTNSITLKLNDDALSGTGSQVKMLAHKAWDLGYQTVQQFRPYPKDTVDSDMPQIYIEDSSGDQLAETNLFGEFKYTAN